MLNDTSNAGLLQINVGGDGTSEAEGGCCHPGGAWIDRNTTLSDNRSEYLTCHAGIELNANNADQQLLSLEGGLIRGAWTFMIELLVIRIVAYNGNEVLGSLLVIIRCYTINVPIRTMLKKGLG